MGASLIEVSEKGRFCVCVTMAYLGEMLFLNFIAETVNPSIDSFAQIKSNGVSQKVVVSFLTGLYSSGGRRVLALGCWINDLLQSVRDLLWTIKNRVSSG